MKKRVICEISQEESAKPELLYYKLTSMGHRKAIVQLPQIKPQDTGKQIFLNKGSYYLEEQFDMEVRIVNLSIKDFSPRSQFGKLINRSKGITFNNSQNEITTPEPLNI